MNDHTLAGRTLRAALALVLMLPLFAYFAPSALATTSADFEFRFMNGEVIAGTTSGGDYAIPDSVFTDFYAPDPVPFGLPTVLHVSCSEAYPGGWADHNPFPLQGTHDDWQIAGYHITRVLGGGQVRECGETFLHGSITVKKLTKPTTTADFTFVFAGTVPPLPGSQTPIAVGPETVAVGGDGGTRLWSNLDGGSYTLTETTGLNPGGYVLQGIVCDSNLSVDKTSIPNGVKLQLRAGEDVICTFTNASDAPPVPAIDIEKATNGQDADSPTGPSILVGDPVNWTYVVTNTGQVTLSDVAVTDSDLGAISCPASVLAVGASMTCTASGTASLGQYSNIGSVTGTPPEGRQGVSDSDPSHYIGTARPVPAVGIEKATNGHDADTPTGPSILVGDSVTWTYVVTNIGEVDLTGVTVTDSDLGAIKCPATTLAVGASMTCTASGIATLGQYANLGTVTTDQQVSDEDPSHYYGTARPVPAIDIEKATNGQDADTPTGPLVLVGGVVNWTYVVTNTGDVTLYGLVVTDSDEGVSPVCPVIEALAPGDSFTCTATGAASLGQYSNIGYVTGYPGDSDAQVQDEDPSHYYGYEGSTLPSPAVHIEKATNGEDADTGVGPTLDVGDSVVWTYVVTNIGDVALSNVKVTDDRGVVPVYVSGDINSNSVLDLNETWTFTASGTAVAGLYANIGSVEGSYGGSTVTDDDPSHYNASLVSPTTVVNTTVPETLPFTGPTSPAMGGFGAAMVLLGGLVLLAFRKKEDPVVETGVVSRLDRYQV